MGVGEVKKSSGEEDEASKKMKGRKQPTDEKSRNRIVGGGTNRERRCWVITLPCPGRIIILRLFAQVVNGCCGQKVKMWRLGGGSKSGEQQDGET